MGSKLRNMWKIGFKEIQSFARIVGDNNPVHRDPEFAQKTRFKSPIAHGMTALVMLNHQMPSRFIVQ